MHQAPCAGSYIIRQVHEPFYAIGAAGERIRPPPRVHRARSDQRTEPETLLPGSSSSILVIITSVVSIKPAMLAALVSADFVTLVGSMMPALNISTYSPVLALYPMFGAFSPWVRTSSATTAP